LTTAITLPMRNGRVPRESDQSKVRGSKGDVQNRA
jgi:hypothetical protein